MKQLVAVLLAAFVLNGCSAIQGVSNTNLYADLPRSGTFSIANVSGEPAVAPKVGRMLRYKLEKQGYKYSETSPDFLVSFTFDTVPAGAVSSAYTTINRAPQTAYIYGNTVNIRPSSSTAITAISTTNMYVKTIAVRLSRASTGEKLWDAAVSERGWCNQLFVTAPQILSLMFDGFPREQTNVRRLITDADDGAKELRSVFPSDTNWGCRPS